MALAIPRTRQRPKSRPLLDRALGTSRRRRQAAYLALGAALALLRPTLRRVGIALSTAVVALSLTALYVAIIP